MELNKFLNKTDIQLYKGILDKIFREFDTIEPQVLGDLLDKLRELHQNLDDIVKGRQTQSMYDDQFFQYTGEKRQKDSSIKECVKSEGVLLKDIYRVLKNKTKRINNVSK